MSDRQPRFTQDARRVLSLAQEEAERQGVAIDTDHLLLGLLRNERGAAGQILRLMGLNADQVEAWVRRTGQRIEFPHQSSSEQPQPLLILDGNRSVLVSNEAAQELIDHHMDALVNGFRHTGGTREIAIGNRLYLTLSVPLPNERMIAILLDITYVRELHKEQARFVHSALFDAKTPLVSIKRYAELLPQHAQLDEQGRRMIERLSVSAGILMKLLNQLDAEVTVIGAAEISARWPHSCDLKGLVDMVVEDCSNEATRRSVRMHWDSPAREFSVLGEQWALALMLRLVMTNALQASDQGGNVRVSIAHDATNVRLRVQNQYQVYQNLELSLARKIAEAHGGTLEVNSIPGGGTEFVVMLPAATAPSPEG